MSFDLPAGGGVQGLDIEVLVSCPVLPSGEGEGHQATSSLSKSNAVELNAIVQDAGDPATQAFIAALTAANIPHSLTASTGTVDCLRFEGDGEAFNISTQMETANITCLSTIAVNHDAIPEFAKAGVEILSDTSPVAKFTGLDGNGLFHLPIAYTFDGSRKVRTAADVSDDLLAAVGSKYDIAVTITPAAVQDPVAMQAIIQALTTFETSGVGKVVSLEGFRQIAARMSGNEVRNQLLTFARGL